MMHDLAALLRVVELNCLYIKDDIFSVQLLLDIVTLSQRVYYKIVYKTKCHL